MLDFRAPDGSRPEFVHSTTAQGFTLPAGQTAAIFAASDADWEQAALVYLQGHRLHDDLGNYERRVTLLIHAQDYQQQIIFTGWHKEGRPDSELPWHPSQGISGGSFVAWKDTSADAPYNDLHLDIIVGPPIGQQQQPLTATPQYAYEVGVARRAYQISHLLAYLSTLEEARGQTEASAALAPRLDFDAAAGRIIDAYLADERRREPGAGAADLLMAELTWRGHTLQAGSLRDRLIERAREVARRTPSRQAGDS